MRGQDEQQLGVFGYVSLEQRIPHDHPLRQLGVMADEALLELKPRFSRLYAKTGRPSIRMGGNAILKRYGKDYYSHLGKLSRKASRTPKKSIVDEPFKLSMAARRLAAMAAVSR
jgi:hypothetical protein